MLHRTTTMLIAAVALALLADVLFYRQPIGWTAGLFLAVAAATIIVKRPRRSAALPLALTLGMAAAMVEEPGALNVALGIVGLVVLAATARSGWTSRVGTWATRVIEYTLAPLATPLLDAQLANRRLWRQGRLLSGHGVTASRGLAATVRWALPITLGLVFVLLLRQANPIIAAWTGDLSAWLNPARIAQWIAVILGAWALWRHRPGVETPAVARHGAAAARFDLLVSPAVVVRCLLLFNLIFAAQTLLDLRYLWGGAPLPEGMTYAEYAHRGAYPLVATALLAGAFVLVTFRAGGAAERSAVARRLVYLWIAQNVLLLVAAAWRLALYVDAYSLTRWRVAAGVWMGVVAVGFLLIIARVVGRRSNVWLGRGCAILGLSTLYLCAFLNIDGYVASYNVRHCLEVTGEGAPIDHDYLGHLGVESIPAAIWLSRHATDADTRRDAAQLADGLARSLRHDLDNWRAFTFRRWRIHSAL